MVWDFAEANPFGGARRETQRDVRRERRRDHRASSRRAGQRVEVQRTSATQLPDHDDHFDAVITDPPYYDNISYADLSDFFYVWLKRSVGLPFRGALRWRADAEEARGDRRATYRHGGDKSAARAFYEREMAAAFAEAHRVLKPGAPLVCVYAHKTTLGWAALVEALRQARFTITEAWPLDTEMPERLDRTGHGLACVLDLPCCPPTRRRTRLAPTTTCSPSSTA